MPVPKPPFSIGQNAAEYGRTKVPRSRRAKTIRLAAVALVVAVIAILYVIRR